MLRSRLCALSEMVHSATSRWKSVISIKSIDERSKKFFHDMNAYSFDGLFAFGLLLICTCAYLRRIPRLKQWLLSEKKGFLGVLYKASVIGTRLHIGVSAICVITAVYTLFLR